MKKETLFPMLVLALVAMVVLGEPALASTGTAGAGGLPWEEGITKLKDSLTGPLATGLGVIGIFTCGAILLWGGDLNGLFQKLVVMILVLSLVICANKILTYFYKAEGATIADMAEAGSEAVMLFLTSHAGGVL